MIAYYRHAKHRLTESETEEIGRVDGLAAHLRAELDERKDRITAAHVHGAASSVIQALVAEVLDLELGFVEEVILTPQDGLVTRARPDFIFDLGTGRGVLAEVERGGTVNNNHDLKDLWKAHVALDAQHLFLVVPQSNWKPDGSAREKPFVRVVNRMSAFFGDARREIDVVSVHIFGY